MRDQPERRQVGDADLVPVREEPLQVGRHAEHRGRPLARSIGRRSPSPGRTGPGTTTRPPASSVPVANRSGAEWCSGLSTRLTSSASKPHRSRSSSTSARAAGSSSSPRPDALGPPGGAAGDVHRPAPRQRRGGALRAARQRTSSCCSGVSTTRRGSRSPSSRSALARRSAAGRAGRAPRPAASRSITRSTYATEPGTQQRHAVAGGEVGGGRRRAPSPAGSTERGGSAGCHTRRHASGDARGTDRREWRSGKSTVAELLLAELGAVVIDADVLAREVVEPGTPGLAAVVDGVRRRRCSPPTGRWTGRRSAPSVFGDDGARAAARGDPAPADPGRGAPSSRRRRRTAPWSCTTSRCWSRPVRPDRFDAVLVVDVPVETQVERMVARPRLDDREDAEARVARAGRPRASGWRWRRTSWTTPGRAKTSVSGSRRSSTSWSRPGD